MPEYSPERDIVVLRPSRSTLVDFGLIGFVALLVITIHIVSPPELQTRLALDYQNRNVVSLFTSAFVHHDNVHLIDNTLGYLVTVSVSYAISRQADQRRWFRISLVMLVLLLPVPVNLISHFAFTSLQPEIDVVGRGFSGVVAGCVGLALVALLIWIQVRHTASIAMQVGIATFLGLLLELHIIYTGGLSLEVCLLAGLGFSLCGWQLVAEFREMSAGNRFPELAIEAIYVVLMVAMIGSFIYALFPATITEEGTTTNIIGHGAGFVFGVLVSVIVYSLILNRKIWLRNH